MTDMRSILGAMAERNKMEPEEIPGGTYRADDGLLHCKVCDQPVQHRLDIGGTVHLVRCICRCDEERRKREEEEERQRRERMYISTRVAIMYLGRICEIAETAEFYNKPIHPYTQMLLSAIPVISEEEEKLKPKKIISQGEIPSPVNVPTGCRFNTRCKYCIDKCRQEEPQMEEILPGHFVRCHRCHEMLDGVITAEIQEDEF